MKSNKSIFLVIAILLIASLMAACAPADSSTKEPTAKNEAISTITPQPQPTDIPTEAATNTPEPTQTPTRPAWFRLQDTYEKDPVFITELIINNDSPITAKLTADPDLWEVTTPDGGIGKKIKTKGKTECTLQLYGLEGMPYDDPRYDHVDLGHGLIYADTNGTNNGTHYVTYILSKFSGKNANFDGLFFEASSPAGKWDACRPLVRAVLGTLAVTNE